MNTTVLCRIGCVVVLATFALSCSEPANKRSGTDSENRKPWDAPKPLPAPKPPMDVGDIESMLTLYATIDDQSKSPAVAVNEMVDVRGKVDMVTLDVTPPAPQELWVAIKVSSKSAFNEGPVVLHCKVMRDNDTIQTFDCVGGRDPVLNPDGCKVNVLSGLPSAPATMLVHAEAEVILLPAGTDPGTINPAEVKGGPDTTGVVLSNPVRINLKSEEAKP